MAIITVVQDLGSIHSHFVHLILNSMADYFDIDSINTLIFCTGSLMTKLHLNQHQISYDVKYIAFLSLNNRYKKKSALIESMLK